MSNKIMITGGFGDNAFISDSYNWNETINGYCNLGNHYEAPLKDLSFSIKDRIVSIFWNGVEVITKNVKLIRGGLDDIVYYGEGVGNYLKKIGIRELK